MCVPVESKPELDTIYTALVGKGAVRRHGNLQCSGNSDDFCYLCAYCDQADSSGLLLKDHINSLVAQGKEVQQAGPPRPTVAPTPTHVFPSTRRLCPQPPTTAPPNCCPHPTTAPTALAAPLSVC